MLATMTSELQKQLEDMSSYDMIITLKEMFQEQARVERYKATVSLTSCKMVEGSPVSAHVLKMKSYLDQLEKLGSAMPRELAVDIILGSLPPSFKQFIMNFNMHQMEKSITELHGMLKNAQEDMKTNVVKDVLMV